MRGLISNQSGATLIEYVGLAVLILLGIWVAATQLAGGISNRLGDIKNKIGM
ncbi:MAG: hypothetical protein M1130_09610 [Actinobacteria bacterium]|nr:hypothetical protein [Actinomycetota bacterium]